MIEHTRATIDTINKRLENIETCLMKLIDVFENVTEVKALSEEIKEIKKDVAKLSEERNIFNKK